MALVQYGGGITNFRGSIVGNTFQRNRAGEIVRARGPRTGRASQSQAEAAGITAATTFMWSNLAAGFKPQWNDFASQHPHVDKFGTTRILSGFNYFTLINSNLLRIGSPIRQLPPPFQLPVAIRNTELVLDPGFIRLGYEMVTFPEETMLFLFTTPPTSRLLPSVRSLLRFTRIIEAKEQQDLDITDDYSATHGFTWPPLGVRNFLVWMMIYPVQLSTGLILPATFNHGDIFN